MLANKVQSLCLALGLASQVYGHAFDSSIFIERDVALYGPFSKRHMESMESGMMKRQSGAPCGSTKGNVACGPGLCCSDTVRTLASSDGLF
jgi:hypothetical protein